MNLKKLSRVTDASNKLLNEARDYFYSSTDEDDLFDLMKASSKDLSYIKEAIESGERLNDYREEIIESVPDRELVSLYESLTGKTKKKSRAQRAYDLALELQHLAGFTEPEQSLKNPSWLEGAVTWFHTESPDGNDAIVTIIGWDDGLVSANMKWNDISNPNKLPHKKRLALGDVDKEEEQIIEAFKENIAGMRFYGFQEGDRW